MRLEIRLFDNTDTGDSSVFNLRLRKAEIESQLKILELFEQVKRSLSSTKIQAKLLKSMNLFKKQLMVLTNLK